MDVPGVGVSSTQTDWPDMCLVALWETAVFLRSWQMAAMGTCICCLEVQEESPHNKQLC